MKSNKICGRMPVALGLALTFTLAARPVDASQQFAKGSLIIPMQTSFQDACGLVSAYGLIYEILAANYYLRNTLNQPGITIHWVYRPGKKSPNRCVPTNLHPTPQTPGTCVAPFTGASCSSTLPYQDTAWNDGCDFSVSNTLAEPVRLIDNASGNDVAGPPVGSFNTNNTTTGSLQALSYPNYKGIKVQHTVTASSNVTAVQYSGGAFVIAAADAPNFLALLKGTTIANDFFGDAIDFKPFRSPGACGVTVNSGVAEFTTAMPAPNTNTFANVHYVKIHRAMTAFSAEDTQKMSDVPGKIALLVTAGGQAGYSSAANGIKSDMLPAYLASAGLGSFKNAQGCSPTGYNAKSATSNCPSPIRHGLIYDAFDVFDLQDSDVIAHTGPLEEQFVNSRGDSKFYYQNLWVPHWEGSTFSVAGRTCDDKCINMARSSLRNVSNYRKVGVLAECGSLAVIEGAADVTDQASGGFWYPPVPAAGDTDGGIPDASVNSPAGQYSTKIATCGETAPDSGICLPGTATPALRGLLHEVNNFGIIGNAPLRNCTDPNMTAGSSCVYYPAPGDPFAQVGDQLWFPRYGLVSDFKPYDQSLYRPEFSPLAFTIPNLDTTQMGTYAQIRAQAEADLFTSTSRQGPSSDGSASSFSIYLGGHTYASDVAGTRAVLNTMLALGTALSSQETAETSPTAYNGDVYIATYRKNTTQDPNVLAPSEWKSFNPNLGSSFQFPYHTGAVRGHPIAGATALAAGANNYTDAITNRAGGLFSSDVSLPLPGARNIFTYLGGDVQASPALGAGRTAPIGGLQVGWTPVDIDYPSADILTCGLDKFRIGEINSTTKPSYTGAPYAGQLVASDGVCDLQTALEVTTVNLGADHGTANGGRGGSIPASILAGLTNAQELLQLVRGYCYATTTNSDGTGNLVPHPSTVQCNFNYNNKGNLQNNQAAMGGVVHSQPAIIAASQLVKEGPPGKHRPTVLYVGGLDGMLHALYVPSDGLDTGYTGPLTPLKFLNSDASSTFVGHTVFPAAFAAPAQPLVELWAFIPPGQLPLLQSNDARVDSSPAVIDVFGDFGATGLREWHTVLVASAGGSNREIFALDVTNPLKPVMLWDLQSSFEQSNGLQYSPVRLANDDTGLNTSSLAQSFRWANGCHDLNTCTPSRFLLPPLADPGRTVTGLYNYAHLGASLSVSAAPLRRNNAPVFAAFIASNEPQDVANSGNGMFTFAIDLVTGQKLWEFNNPYYTVDDPADQVAGLGNTAPPGVTLFSKAGNSIIDTAYVGDEEGSLWELDAADGVNQTSYGPVLSSCAGANCNFPLSQAFGDGTKKAQPISTLSTVFVVPTNYPANGPLSAYTGQALLAYGTAGTDVVSSLEPANGDCSGSFCITGYLHLLPIAPSGRYGETAVANSSALRTTVQQVGVANEVPLYPLGLPVGERLFGSVVAAGTNLFFSTNKGAGSQLDSAGNQSGANYRFDLAATVNVATPFSALANSVNGGAAGTPLLYVDPTTKAATLISLTDQKITVNPIPNTVKLDGPSVNGKGDTPATFLGWFFRRRGSEY